MITEDNCKSCLYICECCKKRDDNCSACKPFGSLFYIKGGTYCRLIGESIKLPHRYKVGDKVKIISNLKENQLYDGCRAVSNMIRFRGRTVTISSTYYNSLDKARYGIEEDRSGYSWSEDMLE